ncbi:MAG: energy transducer TonB, partial [Gemmatimonadetes bacterium]|nr:energy transducer TonB [Gemmatimonadota bacterium]
KVTIDARGRVADATVADADFPELGPPALEAVRQWKFKPARSSDGPVKSVVVIPITFSLNRD